MNSVSFPQPFKRPLPDPAAFATPPQTTTTDPWTPTKTYPFTRTSNGQVKVLWSPTASKTLGKRSVIYQIKNRSNFKRYLGQTTVDLFKRISAHLSQVNNEPDSPLYRDLHKNPENFEVGAIPTSSPDEDESNLIDKKNTILTGYNRRRGGGGGRKRINESVSQDELKKHIAQFSKVYFTPPRYSLKRCNGRITHMVPQHVLKQANVIYRIQQKTAKGIHVYIGCTERKFVSRLREHLFFANHAAHKLSKNSRLYRALHKKTEFFSISIIDSELFPQNLPVSVREQVVIQFYKNRGYTLYNSNQGGGGGSAKK